MGYTHYWKNSTPASAADWLQFTAAASRVIHRARYVNKIKLACWNGTGAPVVNNSEVGFNGRDPEAFESFRIARGDSASDFCKTGRRPYDAAVVGVLIVAAHTLPGFSWSSDGDPEDHAEGLRLAQYALLNVAGTKCRDKSAGH